MNHFEVTVLINYDSDFLHGYKLGDRLGYDERTVLRIEAADEFAAAEEAFAVGNGEATDANGKLWSLDVRSFSVGDVAQVSDLVDSGHWLSCEGAGFKVIERPNDVSGTLVNGGISL